VGEALALLELLEPAQDLGLDRDVHRRGRLVEDEQLGGDREGPRDHDPLALSPAQLGRRRGLLGGEEARRRVVVCLAAERSLRDGRERAQLPRDETARRWCSAGRPRT